LPLRWWQEIDVRGGDVIDLGAHLTDRRMNAAAEKLAAWSLSPSASNQTARPVQFSKGIESRARRS